MTTESKDTGNRTLRGAAWMVAFRMVSRVIGLASTLLLARLLNTADFGIVAIAYTISAAFNSLSNIGVTENLVRHHRVEREVLDTGFTVQVIKGLITGVLLAVAAPMAAAWFSEPRLENVIYLLAAAFTLAGFENVGIIHFRREMRFDREFQLSFLERMSAFVVTLGAALLLRNYWALVLGTAFSKVVRLVATYVMHPYRPRLGLKGWHELAAFSLWMWLSSLVYILWTRADPLVVGSEVSKAQLGLFVVALDLALLPTTEILEPIGTVLFAGFAADRNAGRDPRENAFTLAVSLMAIMAPIAIVLSAASTYIVDVLLGAKWSAAAPIVAILTMSVMLSPFSNTAAQVLTATGRLKANLAVVLVASLTKCVLLYFAAQTGSLYVIAVASLTIISVESSLFVFILLRNGSRLHTIWRPFLRVVVSLAAAAAGMYATGLAWAGDAMYPLFVCLVRGVALGVIGGGVYSGVLLGLWNVAGRPDGPERQIVTVILPLIRRVRTRVLALFARGRFDAA